MKQIKNAIQLFLASLLVLFTLLPHAFAEAENEEGTGHLNYIALGDSLAAGVSPNGTIIKGYTDFIKDGIEAQTEYQVNLVNHGTPSYTTQDLLNQLSNPDIISSLSSANLITIDIGANDLIQALDLRNFDPANPEDVLRLETEVPAAIQQVSFNLGSILSQISTINPDATVYVMGYYNALPYFENIQPQIIQAIQGLNNVISAVGQSVGATFVPTFAGFDGKYLDYLPNPENIHPNQAGYQVIAGQFLSSIIPVIPPIDHKDKEEEVEEETPSSISFGPEIPNISDGNNNNLYFNSTTWDIYLKENNNWQVVGNLQDGTGAANTIIWFTGEGAPANNTGQFRNAYLDIVSQDVYLNTGQVWLKIGTFQEEDPKHNEERTIIIDSKEENLANYLDKDGNLLINHANAIEFSTNLLQLEELNKVYITLDGMSLTIPVSSLIEMASDNEIIKIELANITESFESSLGTVIDFAIFLDNEKYTANFPQAFDVTFDIDSSKVNEWDHLVLRYIDSEGNITDYKDQIIRFDKETGKVVVVVNHFSKYGIFEVESEDTPPANEEEDPDNGETPTPPTNEEEDLDNGEMPTSPANEEEDPANGETPTPPASVDENSDNGETPTSHNDGKITITPVNDKKYSDSKTKKDDKKTVVSTTDKKQTEGSKLPDTATKIYNFLALGALLFVAGMVMIFIMRKRNAGAVR